MKKGDLSLGVIVMAALALLVLIVLAVTFSGQMNIFSRGIKSCANHGGVCDSNIYSGSTKMCDEGYALLDNTDCEKQTAQVDGGESTPLKCCIKVFEAG